MEIKGYIIRIAKHLYRLATNKQFLNPECDINRKSSNDKIYALLSKGKPCLISRFGTVEINCIVNYLCVNNKERSSVRRIWDYISDKTGTPWWEKDHFQPMCNNAGVFPPSVETATKFSEQYLADIPEIDLLGCHQYYEKFMPLRDDVVKVQLEMLYPFFVERPWTRYLKGKRVLVVHPFADTIRKQYEKRELLFNNQDCLPAFELITYKSVQSIGGSEEFKSWFDALEKMEQDIKIIDFDVCLIGCGAYGLPLGAFVKRLGKQAIHIGGGLQLLFGIKGGRWEAQHYSGVHHYNPGIDIDVRYYNLFNEYWVRPSADETPLKAKDVENSCYW